MPAIHEIPLDLYASFTLGGRIAVEDDFVDDSRGAGTPLCYSAELVSSMRADAAARQTAYYGETDRYLYSALGQHPIGGQNVGIIGSTTPWYEAISLEFGAGGVTSVDYNPIACEDAAIRTMTVLEYDRNPVVFDAAIAISSFEHDGLGRYGDPVCPDGDLRAMKKMKRMLVPGGLLFLAVPIGRDRIVWNRHRIYGRLRLPLLTDGWSPVGSFGFRDKELDVSRVDSGYQPVFVLKRLP